VVRFRPMATLSPSILLLWAISSIVQLTVLFYVVTRRHFRTIPLFSLYIALNLCQAALLCFVYSQFGFTSLIARQSSWLSEPIILAAQALAAMEILHRVLRQYAGIWALAWRLVALAAVIVIGYVLTSAKQSPDWSLMILNRGYHLTFAVALISCLILVRFYSIPIDAFRSPLPQRRYDLELFGNGGLCRRSDGLGGGPAPSRPGTGQTDDVASFRLRPTINRCKFPVTRPERRAV
jgi:hypothetical protein